MEEQIKKQNEEIQHLKDQIQYLEKIRTNPETEDIIKTMDTQIKEVAKVPTA